MNTDLLLALGALRGHPLNPMPYAEIIDTGGGFEAIHVPVETDRDGAYVLISNANARVHDSWEVGVFPDSGHDGLWPGQTRPRWVHALELLHQAVEDAIGVLQNWPAEEPDSHDALPEDVVEVILAAEELACCVRGEHGYDDLPAGCRRVDAALAAFGADRLNKLQRSSTTPPARGPRRAAEPYVAITGYQLRKLAEHYAPLLADGDHVWIRPVDGSADDEVYDITTGGLRIYGATMDTPETVFPAAPDRG